MVQGNVVQIGLTDSKILYSLAFPIVPIGSVELLWVLFDHLVFFQQEVRQVNHQKAQNHKAHLVLMSKITDQGKGQKTSTHLEKRSPQHLSHLREYQQMNGLIQRGLWRMNRDRTKGPRLGQRVGQS